VVSLSPGILNLVVAEARPKVSKVTPGPNLMSAVTVFRAPRDWAA
jgi:hypothetical protein